MPPASSSYPPEDTLNKIERILTLTTKVANLLWVLAVGATGMVLWVARMEWKAADHEGRISRAEAEIRPIAGALERVKGHLGLSAITTPQPEPTSSVVWTEDQRREQDRQDDEQATH